MLSKSDVWTLPTQALLDLIDDPATEDVIREECEDELRRREIDRSSGFGYAGGGW